MHLWMYVCNVCMFVCMYVCDVCMHCVCVMYVMFVCNAFMCVCVVACLQLNACMYVRVMHACVDVCMHRNVVRRNACIVCMQ